MKNIIATLVIILIILNISGCTNDKNNNSSTTDSGSESSEVSSSESVIEESSSEQESQENSSSEPSDTTSENDISVSITNLSKSIAAFDMKEKDNAHGWTLSQIEPYDHTTPDVAFYGFLTFSGEVTLTGTLTHVNALFDGYNFVPDEESREKILIPDGNPDIHFSLTIVNEDDPSIKNSLSELKVDESGEYIIVLTQYCFAYVPMTATNNAYVSSIEKI